jgi:lysophospholipase L1-like esterase
MVACDIAESWGVLKRVFNGLIGLLLLLLAMLLFGFHVDDFSCLGLKISINDPAKPFLLLLAVGLVRSLLSVEYRNRLLLLSSMVVGLAIGEIGLRVIDHPLGRLRTLHGWHRPSAATSLEMIPGLSFTSHLGQIIKVNSQGLRDVERSWEKPSGQFRIVALGDSFTFGMGVPLAGTYHQRLETKLKADGADVDVINGGIAGLHAFHATRHFETKLSGYHPDLVTFGFFFDDVQGPYSDEELRQVYIERVKARARKKKAEEEWSRTWKGRIHFLLHSSYLVNFLRGAYQVVWLGRLRSYTQETLGHSLVARHKGLEENVWGGWLAGNYEHLDRCLAVLRRMKKSVLKVGAKLVIVLIPEAGQIHHPEWQVLNQQIKTFCLRENIAFVDPTPRFEAVEDVNSLYLFPRDAHASEAGHELIAQALYDFLKEKGLGPRIR